MKFYQKHGIHRFLWLLLVLSFCVVLIFVAGKPLVTPENGNLARGQAVIKKYAADSKYNIDSLRLLYGRNKQLLKQYELQTLLALSHYPQLKEVAIKFYEEEAILPLASRPEPSSMFSGKDTWQYNIIISTKSVEALEPILLKNVPFNGQVGIIGHELAHTAYYLDKNTLQMLLIALNYPFPSFRAGFEKNTDRRTIAHGLGWQLLEYARFARKVMPYEETDLGSKYYLSPTDIEALIRQTY
jgi:hypothetical protein